jgi:hypothetical protein
MVRNSSYLVTGVVEVKMKCQGIEVFELTCVLIGSLRRSVLVLCVIPVPASLTAWRMNAD